MNVEAVRGVGQMAVAPIAAAPAVDLTQQRELIQAVKAVNASELFGANNELTFFVDRETRRPVVRIVDRSTNEIIRQIPPEYVLRMAEDLKGRAER